MSEELPTPAIANASVGLFVELAQDYTDRLASRPILQAHVSSLLNQKLAVIQRVMDFYCKVNDQAKEAEPK